MMLAALSFALGPSQEVVVVGKPGASDTQSLLNVLHRHFSPNKVVVLYPLDDERPRARLERLAPYVQGHVPIEGKAAAYVCSNYSCQKPITVAEELAERLGAQLNSTELQPI
jgi:uncharacterized protein YyaL (SSP411 family)